MLIFLGLWCGNAMVVVASGLWVVVVQWWWLVLVWWLVQLGGSVVVVMADFMEKERDGREKREVSCLYYLMG